MLDAIMMDPAEMLEQYHIDNLARYTSMTHCNGISIGDGFTLRDRYFVLLGIFLESCIVSDFDGDTLAYRIQYLYNDDSDRFYAVSEFVNKESMDFEIVREYNYDPSYLCDHFIRSNHNFNHQGCDGVDHQGLGEFVGSIVNGAGELPNAISTCANDVTDIHEKILNISKIVTEQTDRIKDLSDMFATVDASGVSFLERIVSRLEDAGLMGIGILTAASWQSAVIILLQYFKTFVPGSAIKLLSTVFNKAHTAFTSLWDSKFKQQGLEKTFSFKDCLLWITHNWEMVRKSEAATKIGDAVTLALTFFCGGTNTGRFVASKAYEIFRLKAWNPTKGVMGFIDTILSTLQFVIEKGALVIETGDISSIFYSKDEWTDIDLEYLKIVEWSKLAITDKLRNIRELSEDVFASDEDYTYRLFSLKKKLTDFRKVESNPINKTRIDTMILRLGTITVAIRSQKKAATYKEAPFCIMFYGDSSINKSLLMNAAAKMIAQANGLPGGNENICSPNESDKYDSEYNDEIHHTLFIDDILNTKVDWYEVPPTNRLLRVKNNQPQTVLKADVESKGCMTWRVKHMILSTNVKDLKAHLFSNLAASIMRRIDYVITVKLKDEFKDAYGGFMNPTQDCLPDAWNFVIQKIKLVPHSQYQFVDEFSCSTTPELLKFLAEKSFQHTELQKKIVTNVEGMFAKGFCAHYKLNNCKECGTVEEAPSEIVYSFGDFDEEFSFGKDFDSVFDKDFLKQSTEEVSESAGHNFVPTVANGDIHTDLYTLLQRNWRSCLPAFALSATVIGLAVASVIQLVRNVWSMFSRPGIQSAEEKTPEPIPGEKENPWRARRYKSVPLIRRSQVSASTSCADLIRMLESQMRVCRIDCGPNSSLCNIVPLCGEYWLGPAHSLMHDTAFRVKLADCARDDLGINGVSEIRSPGDVKQVDGTDYAIIRFTSTPPRKGFINYFPDSHVVGNTVATCIYRPRGDYVPRKDPNRDQILSHMEQESDRFGCFVTMTNVESVAKHQVGQESYHGYRYEYPPGTFNGLCGMALVIQARGSVILGLHLGGAKNTGVAGAITNTELHDTIRKFAEPIIELVGNGGVDDVQYGYSFDQPALNIADAPINPKHCMNYMDADLPSAVEVYGAHDKGTRTLRSEVRPSIISASVTEIMGVKNIHGKPKGLGSWRPFQSNAQNMMVPCNEFDPAILDKAAEDLYQHHFKVLEDCWLRESVHFITDDVAINGVAGISGMDRIDMSTSAGHPVDKPKSTLIDMDRSEMDDHGVLTKIVFKQEVYDRVRHLENKILAGERLYAIFRANVKDEPTKLTKEQLRIFAGTQIDFLILCKKALSGLNRVMQIHWDKFECCISANCYDDDWTKLFRSIYQGDDNRFFCGDYKHWDKSLSPTLLRAAAGVIKRLCAACAYTPDQLKIVNAILLELIYPIYEWDGVYAQFLSSMPSGVFLTVMMSNICNGLLFRYTFYKNAPCNAQFSDYMKCNFMGDDNIGTVSSDCNWWNQVTHATILGDIGIQYTAADKQSELTPFVSLKDCSYLKRKFVWHAKLQQYLAPIDEGSIFKTLHNYMKRKRSMDTPEMISGGAIDHAIHEWFRHGREVYEEKARQLEIIASRHKLFIYCHTFKNGRAPFYDELIQEYNKALVIKYQKREDYIIRADDVYESLLFDFQ
jgi:hypothetical protein